MVYLMSCDLGQFIALVGQAQSPDESVRGPAYEYLNNLRNAQPFQFLTALGAVLQSSEEIPPQIRQICMIYATKLLESLNSPNPTMTNEAYIMAEGGDLITALTSLCPKFFTVFPNESASLFASLAGILMEANVPVLESLVEQMSSVEDPHFLLYALMAIGQVVAVRALRPDQYQPLLKRCFEMISAPLPIALKEQALKVIQSMISDIELVFSSPDNCKSILDMLEFAVHQDQLKVAAYWCYHDIARYYFPVFLQISQGVLQTALSDLASDEADPDVVKAGGALLECFADMERENESQDVSRALFPVAFPILTRLYVRHMDVDPWELTYYDEHTQVIDALISVIRTAGDVCFEPIMQFVKENQNHQAHQLRELCGSLLSNVCSIFRDRLDGIIEIVFAFCMEKFSDPQIRVRETAMSVVHGVLDDDGPLTDRVKEAVLRMLPSVVERIGDGPCLGAYSCEIIAVIAQHKLLGTIQPLFNQLLACFSQEDQVFINQLTEALMAMLDNLTDYKGFRECVTPIFELTQRSFTDPAMKRNQSYIIDIFCRMCRKANEEMIAPAVGPLFELFTQEFRTTGATDGPLLLAVACLGSTAPSVFEPLLPQAMTFALRTLLVRDVGARSLCDATSAILDMNSYFSLVPYLDEVCQAAFTTAESMSNDYDALISLVHFINGLVKKEENSQALNYVIRTIRMIQAPIAEIPAVVDRKQAWTFSIECLRFLRTMYNVDQGAFQQWVEIEYGLVFSVIQLNKWKDPMMEELVGFIGLLADASAESLSAFMAENQCVVELLRSAKENGYADDVNRIEIALQQQL